jgi:D-beta-D-heptose 7-phosphate kinase/D-beta-D-heptose 1-phosphate adenosyltransferase
MKTLSCRALLITRGEHGMALFEMNGEKTDFPTVARKVYDVTGAGDTVISTAALTLAGGGDFREAAILANHAAGVVIKELGAVSVTPEEVRGSFVENGYGTGSTS